MGKKRSATVHTNDGQELVFTSMSFDCCYSDLKGGSIIWINNEEFEIIEKPAIVSQLLDELED